MVLEKACLASSVTLSQPPYPAPAQWFSNLDVATALQSPLKYTMFLFLQKDHSIVAVKTSDLDGKS